MMPIALLLAAGRGVRFGQQDKLLAPLSDGTPLVLHSARNLLAAGVELVVIVRPGSDALQEVLRRADLRFAVCPDADRGIGHSLRFGVEQCAAAPGWLIALADMPSINPESIRSVAEALQTHGGIVAPRHAGRQGHPVGFSAAYYDELHALHGDRGARAVVKCHPSELRLIDVNDPGVLEDVDRPEDLPG